LSDCVGMADDPAWFRQMAAFWRDLAEIGDEAQREARLKLALGFEKMAEELIAKLGSPEPEDC